VGRRHGLDAEVLPIRSVGVKADLRAYEHPALLSGDAPWETLHAAASVLTSEVPGINRCIWNLGVAPPATAVPLAASVTRERLDLLREADHAVMEGLRRHGLYDEIWQCPTVLVPLDLAGDGGELVVVRPVRSKRAMTAAPVELPPELLDELRRDVLGLAGVSGLALDLTSKPPGTIEWE
jgi:GMP synthase (glutamine-hydrolysing)